MAIADGPFEKATGYRINWKKFNSGAKVINAMASGDVHIALAASSPIAAGVSRAGVRSVPIEQIHAAYSFGANRMQVLWHVIAKGALPEILTGMRIGIGFGWTILIAAELVATEESLGAMIMSASEFLVTDVVVMGIIVIGIIAYSFDLFMR